MRQKIIAGNWKMNKTPSEASVFAFDLAAKCSGSGHEVLFCVPFTAIPSALEAAKGTDTRIGAQNMHYEDSGAYTGEISADMLSDLGIRHVIIGHSERRQYFGETNETVNKKALKAVSKGITPIICVGENLTEREQGITIDLVRQQVKIAYIGITASQAAETVIAYEPIWAIGTGKTATSAQAQEVCAAIRKVVSEIYDDKTANAIRIQYGGSVTADNAKELFGMPDIDGGLVGGASLKADFEKIVKHNK